MLWGRWLGCGERLGQLARLGWHARLTSASAALRWSGRKVGAIRARVGVWGRRSMREGGLRFLRSVHTFTDMRSELVKTVEKVGLRDGCTELCSRGLGWSHS